MLALLGISTLASLVASLVLGVRLLRLYRRTREVPELIMGSAFLSAGVVGYVFMLVGTGGAEQMPADVAEVSFLIGYGLISGGVILTYLFVWRVFRPTEGWARVLIGIACPLVAVTGLPIGLPTLGNSAALGPGELAVFWLGHAVRIACGVWGSLEGGRYWLAMRKRQRLGLADAVVTNRILLWAMAAVGSVVIFTSTAIANAGGTSMDTVMSPGIIVTISSVTFAVATCQWLAFLPPRWYLSWVARRNPQPNV